jgi:CRP/FNR family transcriptional regulator, cyclic AMP receptor protein
MTRPVDYELEILFKEKELSALEEVGSVIRFPAASILMGQNESTDFALLIRKGYVKVVAGSPERIVGIRGPGEIVGEMAAIRRKPRSASIFALDDVEALYVPGPRWLDFLIEHPRVALAQLYASQERLAESTRKNVESMLSGEQKLAKAIVELWDKGLGSGSGDDAVLRFSQQDLADIAGVSLDSVKQIIRSFKHRGLVATGRQVTRILNLDALSAVSRGGTIASLKS